MANTNAPINHKINNSYESEPSSGSGSSLSENNEGHISDEEHMNLPYLLNPKPPPESTPTPQCSDSAKSLLRSSQESPFLGFGSSPYGSINKRLYGSQLENLKLPEPQQKPETITASMQRKSPGMVVFPRFYDTVVEENSCNAVDLQLPQEQPVETSDTATSCLSFNGKIKSLTDEKPTTSDAAAAQLTESFVLNKYNNEKSPDLFADSDGEEATENNQSTALEDVLEESQSANQTARTSLATLTESSFVDEHTLDTSTTQMPTNDPRSHFLENCRRERELYRRIRRCLQGVRPPPSVTTPDVDVVKTVVSMKANILNFLSGETPSSSSSTVNDSGVCTTPSLFKPTHSLTEAQNMGWRDILGIRQHGLSYNLNKAAEQNEYLSLSVVERYVGMETASSYIRSPSSAKKRNLRNKLLCQQSPGNRLSHLAKRRAIFSSASLATNSQKLNSSIGPQILLDKKKARNKRKATPKRKTPGSKKKARKTPSSSARKRLFRNDLMKPGPSREASKRALFQSPAKSLQQQQQLQPPKPLIKPEIANRVEKSKRALFSPDKRSSSGLATLSYLPSGSSQLETLLKRKRNDNDDADADELVSQSSKLFRANSNGSGLTPRALKIKSQSFCIGAGTSAATAAAMGQQIMPSGMGIRLGLSGSSSNLTAAGKAGTPSSVKLQRAQSEMCATPQIMTDNQRKKLLWAVSQALQERKIPAKHEQFRQLAADLARIVKRIFQEFYLGHTNSNSETLLRLAKKYAYTLVNGKNADDIYLDARGYEIEAKRQSSSRLSGYIGPEEFEQRKLLLSQTSTSSQRSKLTGSLHNLFGSENSMDSFNLSQTTSGFGGGDTPTTQSSLMERLTDDLFGGKQRLPIQPNPSLQNSSSKSNLGGLALRENVDCEQRRSAQKNFTGKDQRNYSPYFGAGNSNSNGSARKFQSILATVPGGGDSSAKARRQISFDS